jgi:flagellar biosynthetic protein FlhB
MEKSLRMTRQEVVHEHREMEGDPIVKARIFSIMRAKARQRMMREVPTADVVVVNPTEIAVALKYDGAVAPAPIVVAMGRLKLAERIRAIATQSGVPIVENRPVARALIATAVVSKPIPPALYAAVAEILAFVYRRRGRVPDALAQAERGSA